MAAYRRVYDSRHQQAGCQEPRSAPEPYARKSSMVLFSPVPMQVGIIHGVGLLHVNTSSSFSATTYFTTACIWTCQTVQRGGQAACLFAGHNGELYTRSSAIAEEPRDGSCQLKSCQLPRNSAEITCRSTTKSCCRQSLAICAINYSGRPSRLGGIINLVDRRQPSLSRSERPPFSS